MGGTLQPVQYEFNDQSNTALVTFHGYLDIDPHQYNGGYKFSSITLSGRYHSSKTQQTRLYGDDLSALELPAVDVSGGIEKPQKKVLTLQDVDPIVAEIQLNNDDPIEVNLDRNKGPKSVSFDIYVSETGRSNQGLKDNTVLDRLQEDSFWI